MLECNYNFIKKELIELEGKNLLRYLRLGEGPQGAHIVLDGKKVVNFCSNNYLGLANDKRIVSAAIKSLRKEGLGSGASRLVCGNMQAHEKLEKRIAKFKKAEKALVFNSGYAANVGIISALFGKGDIIFSDRLNHASIVDGIILSRSEFKRYPHNDMKALEGLLQSFEGYKKKVIITDSVFSMDGDIAPLKEIVTLANQYKCMVMIDEAHAFGVMGESGRGLAEYLGVEDEIDIQMGTFSKAAGCFGAYVCGSKELINYLLNKSRSFIYSTSLPPMIAAASLAAVDIIERNKSLRRELWEKTKYALREINNLGFNTLSSQTPIIPIVVEREDLAIKFSKKLLEGGIFVAAIRPPTVPKNSARLRVSIIASHTKKDINYLLDNLERIGKDLCLI